MKQSPLWGRLPTEIKRKCQKFQPSFWGLIGRNRRVVVVDHCRLICWSGGRVQVWSEVEVQDLCYSWINLEHNWKPININWRAMKAVLLRAALSRSSAGSKRQSEFPDPDSETQDLFSQCQPVQTATSSVHPTSATEWGRSCVNKAFLHLKRI